MLRPANRIRTDAGQTISPKHFKGGNDEFTYFTPAEVEEYWLNQPESVIRNECDRRIDVYLQAKGSRPKNGQWLDIEDAALFFGVSTSTIYHWIGDGAIPISGTGNSLRCHCDKAWLRGRIKLLCASESVASGQ